MPEMKPVKQGADSTLTRDAHFSDDVDQGYEAHHHTLGFGPGQAMPGDAIISGTGNLRVVGTHFNYGDPADPTISAGTSDIMGSIGFATSPSCSVVEVYATTSLRATANAAGFCRLYAVYSDLTNHLINEIRIHNNGNTTNSFAAELYAAVNLSDMGYDPGDTISFWYELVNDPASGSDITAHPVNFYAAELAGGGAPGADGADGAAGPAGPAGAAGANGLNSFIYNDHGAVAGTARIAGYGINIWRGSVFPTNADLANDMIVWTG